MESTQQSRRWLITGASRGLGLAIAQLAVERGDKVAMLARSHHVMDAAAGLGPLAVGLQADMQSAASIGSAIQQVAGAWGGLDVVVNNAGLHRGGLISKLKSKDWSDVLATNLTGPFHAIRAALPHMVAGGSIVNVGAVVGFRGFAGDAPYGASKAGLAGLTQVLAVELARQQIRVNLVVPGFVRTQMTDGVSERARTKLLQRIPLGREGAPREIAEVVWWVAGSTYMTGSVIMTDGGLMCSL